MCHHCLWYGHRQSEHSSSKPLLKVIQRVLTAILLRYSRSFTCICLRPSRTTAKKSVELGEMDCHRNVLCSCVLRTSLSWKVLREEIPAARGISNFGFRKSPWSNLRQMVLLTSISINSRRRELFLCLIAFFLTYTDLFQIRHPGMLIYTFRAMTATNLASAKRSKSLLCTIGTRLSASESCHSVLFSVWHYCTSFGRPAEGHGGYHSYCEDYKTILESQSFRVYGMLYTVTAYFKTI